MPDEIRRGTLREWCFSPHSVDRMAERFPELLSDEALVAHTRGDLMPVIREMLVMAEQSVLDREFRPPRGPAPEAQYRRCHYRSVGLVVFVCRPGDYAGQKYCVTILKKSEGDRLMTDADFIRIRTTRGKYEDRVYGRNRALFRTKFNKRRARR